MDNLCAAALSYLLPTPLYGFAIDYKFHLLKGWPGARLIEGGGVHVKNMHASGHAKYNLMHF